jgi:hypothetical protein
MPWFIDHAIMRGQIDHETIDDGRRKPRAITWPFTKLPSRINLFSIRVKSPGDIYISARRAFLAERARTDPARQSCAVATPATQ